MATMRGTGRPVASGRAPDAANGAGPDGSPQGAEQEGRVKAAIGWFRKGNPSPELVMAAEDADRAIAEAWASLRREMVDRMKEQHR